MEIRKSVVDSLAEKTSRLSYKKYLPSLTLTNVRSFKVQTVNFDFPVTAIIGTNGGGKSTILGALALAYKSTKPRDFFPKSNVADNSMNDWRIEYKILDRTHDPKSPVTRTARFTSTKWRRENALSREVIFIPIQRTVPANEQTKFKPFIVKTKNRQSQKSPISNEILDHVGRILGKDAKDYAKISLSQRSNQTILVGLRGDNDYSQFHFGAGEASIIEMVSRIEAASENSLILIEEIENGLHPLATQKMVEFLFHIAQKKKSQIIFTTHSEYALKDLPPNAVWACVDGVAYQGKLSIESLRALTGSINKDKVIFVEDDFARDLILETMRQYAKDIFPRLQIHKAGGYPYVTQVLDHHKKNPTVNTVAVAIVDGDINLEGNHDEDVIRLPSGKPDTLVFEYVKLNAKEKAALIQQRCQCPSVDQDFIVNLIDKIFRDTTDHHLYFKKFGNEMGFISEIVIRNAFISLYVEGNKEALEPIVQKIRIALNLNSETA